MSDYTDLIAEARVWPRDGVSKGPLINALADAIEALVKKCESLSRAMQSTDDYRIADWQKLESERDEAEGRLEALVKERDEALARVAFAAAIVSGDAVWDKHERLEQAERERDALAAEVERLKLVHVGQARLAMLAVCLADVDGDDGTQAFYQEWVRNHDAALIESLADDRGVDASEGNDDDEWWMGYRQAQREIIHWLTERARQVREGEA